MLSSEIKKKIKFIKFKTKRVLNGTLIGDQSSAIKGTGHEFDQIREYQQGDDVRFVDWKSSARMNKLLIKQYFEERNRNIIIALDISSSLFFSSENFSKHEIISQIAAILALVTDSGKDNVGLLLFSDKIVEFIPEARGKVHVMNILKKIFEIQDLQSKTNINLALDFLIKNTKKDSVIFFLSDFINDNDFDKQLKVISKKCKFVAIRCTDKYEQKFPDIGFICIKDIESDEILFLDARKKNTELIDNHINFIKSENFLKKHKIKSLCINNNNEYLINLISFFKKLMY